jgi:hypothetical protein
MTNEKITLAELKAKGACYWGDETAKRVEENLPATLHEIMCWEWVPVAERERVFRRFATATAWEAYKQATETAWKAYKQATAPAWKAHEQATKTAREAYEQATATAGEAYDQATKTALMENSK